MNRRTELIMKRRSVAAFIEAEQVLILFTRVVKTETSNGSWVEQSSPLAVGPQLFRVVPFKRRLSHQEADTQDGAIPTTAYVLIGKPGVDVKRDDEFKFKGRDCKVVGIEAMTSDEDTTDRVVVEFEAR